MTFNVPLGVCVVHLTEMEYEIKHRMASEFNTYLCLLQISINTSQDDSDDSGTQVDIVPNRTISSIHGDGDDEHSDVSAEYEDPPGSVIDLRNVSRASMKAKLTPRIHRRAPKNTCKLI